VCGIPDFYEDCGTKVAVRLVGMKSGLSVVVAGSDGVVDAVVEGLRTQAWFCRLRVWGVSCGSWAAGRRVHVSMTSLSTLEWVWNTGMILSG
jgi:hypothetical protein